MQFYNKLMPNHQIRSQFACCIFLLVHNFFSSIFWLLLLDVCRLPISFSLWFFLFSMHMWMHCVSVSVWVCFSFSSKYILSCLLPCILFYLQFAFEYRRRLCCMDPIDKTYFVFYLRSLCLFVSHPHCIHVDYLSSLHTVDDTYYNKIDTGNGSERTGIYWKEKHTQRVKHTLCIAYSKQICKNNSSTNNNHKKIEEPEEEEDISVCCALHCMRLYVVLCTGR